MKRSLVIATVLSACISLQASLPATAETIASGTLGAADCTSSPQVMLTLHRPLETVPGPANSNTATTIDTHTMTPTAESSGSVDRAQVSDATSPGLGPNALAAASGTATDPAPAPTAGPTGQPGRATSASGAPSWQNSETPFAPEGAKRSCAPSPLDPVFPSTEWTGVPVIGLPDTNPVYKLEAALYKACPVLKKKRIEIYGWANPGGGYSSSHQSNIPLSYAIVPRRLEMEQLVLRFDRSPDTVQKEHNDWGFRVSNVFGIDYRYTTAAGWYPASSELLKHNRLYGFDLVECFGLYYIPKIAKGMSIRYGRYISPPDIEAQLSPDNYLWTHSLMFTYDAYTHTGVQVATKLSDNLTVLTGMHAGSDMAPWFKGAEPTAEMYLRWVSKTNNDSIFAGCDAINNGRYRLARETVQVQQDAQALTDLTGHTVLPPHVPGHDNLQQLVKEEAPLKDRIYAASDVLFADLNKPAATGAAAPPKNMDKKFLAGLFALYLPDGAKAKTRDVAFNGIRFATELMFKPPTFKVLNKSYSFEKLMAVPMPLDKEVTNLLTRFIYSRIFGKWYFGGGFAQLSVIAGFHHLVLLLALTRLHSAGLTLGRGASEISMLDIMETIRQLEEKINVAVLDGYSAALWELLLFSPRRIHRVLDVCLS